jgi:hypothetical protein
MAGMSALFSHSSTHFGMYEFSGPAQPLLCYRRLPHTRHRHAQTASEERFCSSGKQNSRPVLLTGRL